MARGLPLTLVGAAIAFATMSGHAAEIAPGTQSAASIPDFSGIWAHPSLNALEQPLSGPGPLRNRPRLTEEPQAGVGTADPTHRGRCRRFHDALVGDRDVSARLGRMAGTCLRGKSRMVPWNILRGADC